MRLMNDPWLLPDDASWAFGNQRSHLSAPMDEISAQAEVI